MDFGVKVQIPVLMNLVALDKEGLEKFSHLYNGDFKVLPKLQGYWD